MKNLLNSMKKQRGKPIIYSFIGVEIVCKGVKNFQNLARKTEKKIRYLLIN